MKESHYTEEGQATNTIMIAVGIVLIAAIVIWVLSQRNTTVNINDAAQGGSPTITATAGQGGGTVMMDGDDEFTIMELMDNPDQYYGQSVTVEGEVDSVESDQAFVLDQQGAVMGDEVLVLYSTPISFSEEDRVQVRGTVQRLSEVDAMYSEGMTEAMRTEYAEKPVLVATTVTLMSGMSGTPADEEGMMEEESEMTTTPSPTMSP